MDKLTASSIHNFLTRRPLDHVLFSSCCREILICVVMHVNKPVLSSLLHIHIILTLSISQIIYRYMYWIYERWQIYDVRFPSHDYFLKY